MELIFSLALCSSFAGLLGVGWGDWWGVFSSVIKQRSVIDNISNQVQYFSYILAVI
jgi:hypothetical protein